MKIELIEKVQTTQKEFDSVNQNDRPRLSEEIHRVDKPHIKAVFDPSTGEVTGEF